MVLKGVNYFIKGRKYSVRVQLADTFWKQFTGLMFKKSSPPLLFVLGKERVFPIHSFFCKPFRAIWLDKDMRATKVVDVKGWYLHISGRGKYLLEIPLTTKK